MASGKKATARKRASSRSTGSRKVAKEKDENIPPVSARKATKKKDENTPPVAARPKPKPAYKQAAPARHTNTMEDTAAAALLSMGNVVETGPLMEDVAVADVTEPVDAFDAFSNDFSGDFDYTANSEEEQDGGQQEDGEQDADETDVSEVEEEEDEDIDIDGEYKVQVRVLIYVLTARRTGRSCHPGCAENKDPPQIFYSFRSSIQDWHARLERHHLAHKF